MAEVTYTKVKILGEEYKIVGQPKGASIPELAAYVDRKIDEVKRAGATVDSKRLTVLASLNLADELFRERALRAKLIERIRRRAREIGNTIDRALADTGTTERGRATIH